MSTMAKTGEHVAEKAGEKKGEKTGEWMTQTGERRGAPRMSLDAAAVIRFESVGPDVRSRIVNASRNGIMLAMPEERPLGTRMHLTVRIGDPPFEIKLTGLVVHVGENPSAPPGFTTQVGVFLTEAGPAWEALCRRISDGQ